MPQVILSTSNLIGNRSPLIRPSTQKSDAELVAGLRASFDAAKAVARASLASRTGDNAVAPSEIPGIAEEWRSWTKQDMSFRPESPIYMPAIDPAQTGLAEPRESYDITLKLFFLPYSNTLNRAAQTRDALRLVKEQLKIESVDLLVVSFPGVLYEATAGAAHHSGAEHMDIMIKSWQWLEEEVDAGVIKKLGIAEFGPQRLEAFANQTRISPSVDQINVKDACDVPRGLVDAAKRNGVDLHTHNDPSSILPRDTLRELLGPNGVQLVAGGPDVGYLEGDVEPQWVVRYTAVVRSRGVVESKGYFAAADLVGA